MKSVRLPAECTVMEQSERFIDRLTLFNVSRRVIRSRAGRRRLFCKYSELTELKGKARGRTFALVTIFVCLLFLPQKQQEETEPSEKELKCNEGDGRCLAHKGVI